MRLGRLVRLCGGAGLSQSPRISAGGPGNGSRVAATGQDLDWPCVWLGFGMLWDRNSMVLNKGDTQQHKHGLAYSLWVLFAQSV